jgi:hypothetical protein
MRMIALCFLLLLPAFAQKDSPQNGASPMPPTEAFRYAMAPYNDARQQPDDLTDADRWALGISIARAANECAKYVPLDLPKEETELLAMGRLCLLGRQYEQAREALIEYLKNPTAPERAVGFLLLARTFLGLGWLTSAESPIDSLLSEYPYDANTHFALDLVVDAARAQDAPGNEVIRRLDEQQLPILLKTLHGSGSLTTADKSAVASTSVLFRDALRCAAQLRSNGSEKDAEELIAELSVIAADEKYAQSAELPTMQSALKRYALVGQTAPAMSLRVKRVTANDTLLPQTISLRGGTTILLPIALRAPASTGVVEKVATNLKSANTTIYAITSFASNTGTDDKPDAQITKTLGAVRQSLPANVGLFVVPDEVLQGFAIDSYPSGILIDSAGTICFLEPLSDEGAIRALHKALR